ncbi:hypothetical protein C2E25_04625 [Geothermobacter hydrogeniphilus]|uniref:Response regulatory domain-containing protein n=2 Tax=Geothermobacter hydrogeniphilus TaxID=1969733 RepID=A0A2K2HC88_9BACT|nr:hypothetical protein C2E25_04625 [Geothermobacter hydrogeniphilus]
MPMPSHSRKIILVSSRDDLLTLAGQLRAQGFDVLNCEDGARALEMALTTGPALMILETDLPLLPASRLAQILRANPRTEGIAFVFIGREGEEVDGFQRHRDQFFVRPFNQEQLLGALLAYCRRQEQTRQVGREEQEVEGHLNQISLVDLLQIFSLNRKDGLLTLHHGDRQGSIALLGGLVCNARLGRLQGEKAFFRMLAWSEGTFHFRPGVSGEEARITTPTDHLIMEGLRQQDELAAQAHALPHPEDKLVLKVPNGHLPRGLRPATQEILLLLQYYHRVGDILDHCSRPDLEVLQILQVLLDKGLLGAAPRTAEDDDDRQLLSSEEIIAIKDSLGEGDILLEEASAKLVVLANSPADLNYVLDALQGIREFEPEGELLRHPGQLPLGDVGRLKISENFSVRLFCLPTDAEKTPLWRPFCRRLLGVLSLGGSSGTARAEEFFRHHSDAPVVPLAGAVPRPGVLRLEPGDRQGLRQLLHAFAEPFRSPVELTLSSTG